MFDTRRKQVVKEATADEFYKDVPKPSQGWEGFQDFREQDESSSDSQEDVMFYRDTARQSADVQGDWQRQAQGQQKSQGMPNNSTTSEKVFSPFDL